MRAVTYNYSRMAIIFFFSVLFPYKTLVGICHMDQLKINFSRNACVIIKLFPQRVDIFMRISFNIFYLISAIADRRENVFKNNIFRNSLPKIIK